ncbi:MAG TPA: hypothetical protein VHB98_18050 [Chloroflexota bacterium]|nr:hypothetical protein [Chloroflexota bacterium]
MGTKVMAPVSMKLYELESEQARQQEDRVRPCLPYEVAARKSPWDAVQLAAHAWVRSQHVATTTASSWLDRVCSWC